MESLNPGGLHSDYLSLLVLPANTLVVAEQPYNIIRVYVGAAVTFLDSPCDLPIRGAAPATGYAAAADQVAIDEGESAEICSKFVKKMLISLLLMLIRNIDYVREYNRF